MSQDLFAEFGSQAPALQLAGDRSGGQKPSRPPGGTGVQPATSHGLVIVPFADEERDAIAEDDDFGDFEDASNTTAATHEEQTHTPPSEAVEQLSQRMPVKTYPPPKAPPPVRNQVPNRPPKEPQNVSRHPFANHMDMLFAADDDEYDAGADEMADLATNPEAAMAYSKRVIAAQQGDILGRDSPSAPAVRGSAESKHETKKLRKKSAYVPAPNAEVLFDAEEATQDDFGEFEGASYLTHRNNAASTGYQAPDMDLLALGERTGREPLPLSEPTGNLDNDAWDDFETSATPVVGAKEVGISNATEDSPVQHTLNGIAAEAQVNPIGIDPLPPTNVPPPAVLLSIFPSIFASGQEALLDPLSKLDMKQRQVLLAHPATHLFLRGYLGLAVVLGHIIAGRKLRWKRDHYLSQGTRIGPAAAGGKSSGMKLAGVDRSETAKEDREVLDALRLWKAQIGRLRSAVAAASSITPDGESRLPAVPEISEQTVPVRSVKAVEGGVTAPHACALCGLRREERVARVDVEVDDSFGEWWVEGMSMHLLCRKFWEEHRGKLRSR
ncbi:hypothetical protein LTR29_017830 [Friedmanniomyces endolithicus]|nr:hypothetical protein LTR29_017830 [Friedmanniomyces endolithicus]